MNVDILSQGWFKANAVGGVGGIAKFDQLASRLPNMTNWRHIPLKTVGQLKLFFYFNLITL